MATTNKKTTPASGVKHVRPAEKKAKNYCFGCGADNTAGLRMNFVHDEEGKRMVASFRLGRRYTGPPGHLHGGIIATILDEAMGKVNKLHQVTAMTREMTIEYLKPVPLNQPLLAEGREEKVRGRVHFNVGEIRNDKGEVLARSRGTFIAIDPEKMFGSHMKSAARHVAFLQPLEPATPGALEKVKAKASGAK